MRRRAPLTSDPVNVKWQRASDQRAIRWPPRCLCLFDWLPDIVNRPSNCDAVIVCQCWYYGCCCGVSVIKLTPAAADDAADDAAKLDRSLVARAILCEHVCLSFHLSVSSDFVCFVFCNFVFVIFCTYLGDQLRWVYLLFLVARHCASYSTPVVYFMVDSVSLSVCLSDGNFQKTWLRKFIFAHPVYLRAIRVKFV